MELIWMEGILLLKEHNPKVQAGTVMEIETIVVVVTVTATVVAVILEVVVVVGVVVVEAIATNVASLAILQGSALLVMVGTGMVAGMTGIVAGIVAGMTGIVAGMVAGMTGMVVAMAAAAMGLNVVVIAILGAVTGEAAVVVAAIDTAATGLDHMNVAAEMNTDLEGGDSVSGMKAIG